MIVTCECTPDGLVNENQHGLGCPLHGWPVLVVAIDLVRIPLALLDPLVQEEMRRQQEPVTGAENKRRRRERNAGSNQ